MVTTATITGVKPYQNELHVFVEFTGDANEHVLYDFMLTRQEMLIDPDALRKRLSAVYHDLTAADPFVNVRAGLKYTAEELA